MEKIHDEKIFNFLGDERFVFDMDEIPSHYLI